MYANIIIIYIEQSLNNFLSYDLIFKKYFIVKTIVNCIQLYIKPIYDEDSEQTLGF